MQEKKGVKAVFLKVFMMVAVILIANLAVFAYKYKGNFTGNSIAEGVSKSYSEISNISKIFLIAQWAVLILVLAFAFVFDVIGRKRETVDIKLKRKSESGTDLDALYSILQERKILRLSAISKAFSIDKNIALEWCKILEAGNLAVIEQGMGEPVLKIK